MSLDSFPFTYIYNIYKEYAKIAPQFTQIQIKEFLCDLKRNPPLFNNFIMSDGDIILKMTMTVPEIFRESLQNDLGRYSTPLELIQWALFCGPEPPSQLPPMTPQSRQQALHIILDHMPTSEFQTHHTEFLNMLLYFPADPDLIKKLLDKFRQITIPDDWILNFLHRGNSANIPYIVSHRLFHDIAYQTPNFLTKILPQFRHFLTEDESIIGPNDTHHHYYKKLVGLQTKINSARPIIRKANWALVFWFSIFYIRTRQFLARYYEPGTGRGFHNAAADWGNACSMRPPGQI